MSRNHASTALVCLLALVAAAAGCRQDMHDAPRYDPLEASDFFPDGLSARPLVEDTVARGELRADTRFYTGKDSTGLIDTLPVPLNRALLDRGHNRYDVYCSPCHDRVGNGLGMIVKRGYRQPPSLHIDRLREIPVGHFFDVITNGLGAMPDYAAQVAPPDRWAIAAYIRALQLSQHATLADVPPEARPELDRPSVPR